MGGAASRAAALRHKQQEREREIQRMLGLEWKEATPLRPKDTIMRIIVEPYDRSLQKWTRGSKYRPERAIPRGKRVPMKRVVKNMSACIERVAKEMHLDTNFLKDCFDMLGGYPVWSADPRRMGRYPYIKASEKIYSDKEKWLDEKELKLWVAVCSADESQEKVTKAHMDSVFAKLQAHRKETGRSTAMTLQRRADWKDFLVLTYDYYLAFGQRHMHAVFHDLIKT